MPGISLTVPTRYSVIARRADRTTRLDHQPRDRGEACGRGRAGEGVVERAGIVVDAQLRIVGEVAGAEPAAEVELLDRRARGAFNGSGELHDDLDRAHVRVEPLDLRPDVAVQAAEAQRRTLDDAPDGPERHAVRDREPELRLLGAGLDELVRVRLDARRHPHEHRGTVGAEPTKRRDARVDRSRRRSRPRSDRRRPRAPAASSASDLLLPWNTMRSAGKPAWSATCSSPPVATSRCRALLGDEPGHRRAEERLARVRDRVGAEVRRRTRGSGGGARPRRRRTAACRTRPRARSRSAPSRSRRDQRRVERALGDHVVVRSSSSSPRRRISSGACTPRIASAFGEPDPARLGQPEPGLRERGSSPITRQSR